MSSTNSVLIVPKPHSISWAASVTFDTTNITNTLPTDGNDSSLDNSVDGESPDCHKDSQQSVNDVNDIIVDNYSTLNSPTPDITCHSVFMSNNSNNNSMSSIHRGGVIISRVDTETPHSVYSAFSSSKLSDSQYNSGANTPDVDDDENDDSMGGGGGVEDEFTLYNEDSSMKSMSVSNKHIKVTPGRHLLTKNITAVSDIDIQHRLSIYCDESVVEKVFIKENAVKRESKPNNYHVKSNDRSEEEEEEEIYDAYTPCTKTNNRYLFDISTLISCTSISSSSGNSNNSSSPNNQCDSGNNSNKYRTDMTFADFTDLKHLCNGSFSNIFKGKLKISSSNSIGVANSVKNSVDSNGGIDATKRKSSSSKMSSSSNSNTATPPLPPLPSLRQSSSSSSGSSATPLVILKVLAEQLVTNPVNRKEFETEIAVLSALNHPHIVQFIGSGYHYPTSSSKRSQQQQPSKSTLTKSQSNKNTSEAGNHDSSSVEKLSSTTNSRSHQYYDDSLLFLRPIIVLEALNGDTLAYHLTKKTGQSFNSRPFTKLRYLKMMKELADALYYIHEKIDAHCTLIHRDLKPDNIGFTADGTLKLMDFGICVCIRKDTCDNEGLYRMTGKTGSLRYMAPEVALSRPYNEKVDIYSFSLILYSAITGVIPYTSYTKDEFYNTIIHNNQRPPLDYDDYGRDIKFQSSSILKSLLVSCWDPLPKNRPSAKEVYLILVELERVKLEKESKKGFLHKSYDRLRKLSFSSTK